MYKVPIKHFCRLHHIRPRFKNNVEDVLFYITGKLSMLEKQDHSTFKSELNDAIKLFPGNYNKTKKTIDNWRTEITALFGLVERDQNLYWPGEMAKILDQREDLVEFFRLFLYKFQYPGGHLKSNQTLEFIRKGIKFKPASYMLSVMIEGQKLIGSGGKFGLTKEEATHCIFNDLRTTTGNRTPRKTAELILDNRVKKIKYNSRGDTIRYAGDILDYMVLADLVAQRLDGKFYPNVHLQGVLKFFIDDINGFFPSYDKLYSKANVDIEDINQLQDEWYSYVNRGLSELNFEADVLSLIGQFKNSDETDEPPNTLGLLNKVRELIRSQIQSGLSTKQIGDLGETITIEHEKLRLVNYVTDREINNIKKIPDQMAVGYDILSYEGKEDLKRHIEVKTTVSKNKLHIRKFYMTNNEWSTAKTFQNSYFIYRITISENDIELFTIRNPELKMKESKVDMEIGRDGGVQIKYEDNSGCLVELLSPSK